MAKKEKRGPGQPTKYRAEYCDDILIDMRNGDSAVEFAAKIGVAEATIYEWANKHPEFSEALKKGQTLSKAHWMNVGKENMMAPANSWSAGTWMFWMKCRFGFREADVMDDKLKEHQQDKQEHDKQKEVEARLTRIQNLIDDK